MYQMEVLGGVLRRFVRLLKKAFLLVNFGYNGGRLIVDMVIAIVLTAVARELLINFANIESLTLQRGIIITAAILVLSISYWLVNKAEQIKKT